jgi:hypothetical protein
MNRVDRRAHLWFEDLHIDVGRRRDLRVPHHALNALVMTFCQRSDGAPDDLERQLGQPQFLGQFVQDALPEVARIHRPTETASEHERVRRDILAFLPELLSPFHQLLGQRFSVGTCVVLPLVFP